ncbi:hypothetical protein DPX16_7762 [Anabarilius grahami]|uniref:Uncharacterized protein n=1 Tax=Anabarilius grahami TaxID=495550 RepID=A0A3N0XJN4_ANAGA|nr:hypothetical protein DPX16_7762 [Anabarilius grahami]
MPIHTAHTALSQLSHSEAPAHKDTHRNRTCAEEHTQDKHMRPHDVPYAGQFLDQSEVFHEGSTGGTHGAEMEPSARSYPLLKPTGPPHASPRKTSNKTTLRTPLFPYLTQAHVDISYSRQLAWRPAIKLDWHSGCGVGNSEFGAAPETLK